MLGNKLNVVELIPINILGKRNQISTFSIRSWEYPSKNEAREVDVSLSCVCMRHSLTAFYLVIPFYESALSDTSLLLQ